MKKTFKKFLALLLAAVMLFAATPIIGVNFLTLANAADENDLEFKLINNDTEFEIKACSWTASGDLIIPATFGGVPVTSIGELAFYDCTTLESVTFPDSITNISARAFQHCKAFVSIDLPKNLTSMGEYAFYYCNSLESVTFPADCKLVSISDSAFEGCSLASITIPESMTSIGEYAFSECNDLETVTFAEGNNLESIGNGAFSSCGSLESITIPASVTSLGEYVFGNSNNLASITFAEGSKLESIGDEAFQYCDGLESITIPDTVTSIGKSAFYDCSSLEAINVSENNANYSSKDGVLFSKDGKTLICYPAGKADTSYVIPDGVTSICEYAFKNSSSLASITIPESVTSIGRDAFDNTAYYNNSDNWIDDTLYIGDCFIEAGSDCTSCTIAENTRLIVDAAFDEAYKLAEINVPESNASFSSEDGVLFSKEKDVLVCFPSAKGKTTYNIPSSVKIIADYACYGSDYLESVTIPEGVTSIGKSAFEYVYCLISVTFAQGSKLKSIGKRAFYECADLESIDIPYGVTSIGDKAFENCEFLESVTIPEGVTSIGEDAFENCENLASVTIPESVKYIGEDAFEDCDNILDVYYGGNESDWDNVYLGPDSSEIFNAQWHYSIVVADVTLEITSKTLVIGETQPLTATVTPTDATNKDVTYTSSDTAIATVDENGLVTAKAAGTATITVTTRNKGKTATCEITVVVLVTGVTLDVTSKILEINETQQLTATVTPTDATDKNVVWSSSDEEIATVDENGLVTAKAAGTATITVTTADGNKTATCAITVKAAAPATISVTGVTLDVTSKTLEINETQQLTATVTPTDATNKAVTWESSDTAIATVDENGLVTAKAAGTATITVTTADGGKTATCAITVNAAEEPPEPVVYPTVAINNITGTKAINYGDELKFTATATNLPEGAAIVWYVNGTEKGRGEEFTAPAGTADYTVTMKIVDKDGNAIKDANGVEITAEEKVTVNASFFRKLIAFLKNLFSTIFGILGC